MNAMYCRFRSWGIEEVSSLKVGMKNGGGTGVLFVYPNIGGSEGWWSLFLKID